MMTTLRTDYDSPWKEMLEHFLPQFLAFFFPDIHQALDWNRQPQFLETELQQVMRGAEGRARRVDKLARVWLADGEERWLLIHIEVQGQPEAAFAERVYIYNYRIYDLHRRPVVSLAVLTDEQPHWRPERFEYEQWGVEVRLKFRSVKLLDWQVRWAALAHDPNPFSLAVMAHLKSQETRGDPQDRKAWKWTLTRLLYERGYRREEIVGWFRFVDWLMALPPGLEQEFRSELEAYEEARHMQYVSTIERWAEQRGLEQGLEQGITQTQRKAILAVLEVRFSSVPEGMEAMLAQIQNDITLESLHRQAITVDTLENFETMVAQAVSGDAVTSS
jgi:hypothetical protein